MATDHQYTTVIGFIIDYDKLFDEVDGKRVMRKQYENVLDYENDDRDDYIPMGSQKLGELRGQDVSLEALDAHSAPDLIAGIVLGDISGDDESRSIKAPDELIIKKRELLRFLQTLGLPIVNDSYKFYFIHQTY